MDTPTFAALVPMLPVTNVTRSIAFYEELGFQTGNTVTPDGQTEPNWAWLYMGKVHLMLNQGEGPVDVTHESAVAFWLYCDDVFAVHELWTSRGLDLSEISYPFYNPRGEFHVHDPDGYAIFVAHAEQPEK
jgi:hypothetical protein